MKMDKFASLLQAQLNATDPNFGDNADSVLVLLYNTYYEQVCTDDTDEVKLAFDELYESITGKTLREQDEIINAVCRICCKHQQTGFVDGIHLGFQLAKELNNE